MDHEVNLVYHGSIKKEEKKTELKKNRLCHTE